MRVMLQVSFPVEHSNKAVKEGALPKLVGKMMEELKPESAYFFPTNGRRAAQFVFDMKDASQIPPVAEPFFDVLHADVTLTPVMNLDDLKAGLAKIK